MIELLEKRINDYRKMADESNSIRDMEYYNGIVDGLIIALRDLENNKK